MKTYLKLFFIFSSFLLCLSSNQNSSSKFPKNNKYRAISYKRNTTGVSIIAKYEGIDSYYLYEENPIIKYLEISVNFQKTNEFRVSIRDLAEKRWEIPEEEPFPHDSVFYTLKEHDVPLYSFNITVSPFSFKVVRNKTNETLFDTNNFNFIYSDRYIEFSSVLPSKDIFGFGERVHGLKLKFPGVYTIWNRDLPWIVDREDGGENTYGMHPMYLIKEKSGKFHIVYLRNSNGMDILLNKTILNIDNKYEKVRTVTYKMVGGIIDLKFFIGDNSVEELIKSYHTYIGGYTLQPFWSFGFHQSRYGFLNLSMINDTLYHYQQLGIPLDAIWMDIDYMDEHNIFTIDEARFNISVLNDLIENKYKKKLILIIDPGVGMNPDTIPYKEGIKRDIFIKNSVGDPIIGCVWPGKTHFPDFFNKNTQEYWSDMFDLLYEKVKFSGIWLDMNEISNFVDGTVGPNECQNNILKEISQANSILNVLPQILAVFESMVHDSSKPSFEKCNYTTPLYYSVYIPGNKPLDNNAICLNAIHSNGFIEYNTHNFNGFLEGKATYDYLQKRLKHDQPFILSRSTVPGSGKYVIHWTGDNLSKFKWLKLSIAGLVNFNIFGIPNVGADICGFTGNTTEELCSRWMQLGSLYPFSRNHKDKNFRDQYPFSFGETLLKTSMVNLKFRYSILKYYYYLFVKNNGTGTIFRPLFFEFPEEKENYKNSVLDEEFLIGEDLLVTPVVQENQIYIHPYFPGNNATWYEIHEGKRYLGGQHYFITNELNTTAPIFLRSGRNFFRQKVELVNRTNDLDNDYYLSVGFEQINQTYFQSKGKIMACEDFNDYNSLKKCLNGSCFFDVNVLFNIEEESKVLTVNFHRKTKEKFDIITFSRLNLYGLEEIDIKKIIMIEARQEKRIYSKDSELISFTRNYDILVIDFGRVPIEDDITYVIYMH